MNDLKQIHYSGDEDGDFVIWEGDEFVGSIGSERLVEMGPDTIAFDVDCDHAKEIVACVNSFRRNCADPVKAAEDDLLGQLIEFAREQAAMCPCLGAGDGSGEHSCPTCGPARAILAKTKEPTT
jgi:hypothetical protein